MIADLGCKAHFGIVRARHNQSQFDVALFTSALSLDWLEDLDYKSAMKTRSFKLGTHITCEFPRGSSANVSCSGMNVKTKDPVRGPVNNHGSHQWRFQNRRNNPHWIICASPPCTISFCHHRARMQIRFSEPKCVIYRSEVRCARDCARTCQSAPLRNYL